MDEIKKEQEKLKNLNPVDRILNLTNSWGVKVATDPWLPDTPKIWWNNKDKWIGIEVFDEENRDRLLKALENTNFNWTEPFKMSNGNWLVKASVVGTFKIHKKVC